MKKNIVIAVIVATFVSTISANAAEWAFDNQTFENKTEAKKYARKKALEEANALFRSPSDGFLALEKGRSQYLAVYKENPISADFRCTSRNGESLKFEGHDICVLTLRQYASKLLKSYQFEKLNKDEGGFRRASN